MDGFELARQLRSNDDLKPIRLVAVTGYGQEHDRHRTQAAGFDAHLVKPVDIEAVSDLIVALARYDSQSHWKQIMKIQLSALLVGITLMSTGAVAQERPATETASTGPGAASLSTPRPADGFVQPKTPWGDPDLQGFWPGVEMVGVPLQRPARFGTRNVLTEEEFAKRASELKNEEESLLAEIDVFTADVTTPCAIRCPTSPTPHWQEGGKPSRQASLIIDPVDGRQPPLSPEGQARQAQQQAEPVSTQGRRRLFQ
jgi:CheY-like chemotaxis protein